MLFIFGTLKRVSLLFLDVYSTKAFYYTFYFAFFSKVFSLKYIPVVHGGNIEDRIKKSKWMANFVFENSYTNIIPSKYVASIFKNIILKLNIFLIVLIFLNTNLS